jgi:hypothetical protein
MKQLRRARHCFSFKMQGQTELIKAWAKVKDAKSSVELVVTADHVRDSLKRHGVGNTSECTMAICARRSASKFAHPVEGYIDWQYRRCFVVSKLKDGWPHECYVYEHNNEIAHLNDSKDGQKLLLKMIEADGPITVRMHPIGLKKRKEKAQYSKTHSPNRPWQPNDIGTRKSKTANVSLRGAAARFAYAGRAGALDIGEDLLGRT